MSANRRDLNLCLTSLSVRSPTHSFDIVHSVITLQHMVAPLQHIYVEQLCDALTPGEETQRRISLCHLAVRSHHVLSTQVRSVQTYEQLIDLYLCARPFLPHAQAGAAGCTSRPTRCHGVLCLATVVQRLAACKTVSGWAECRCMGHRCQTCNECYVTEAAVSLKRAQATAGTYRDSLRMW